MSGREIALFEHAGSHYLLVVETQGKPPAARLTAAEEEILGLVASGLSNDEIADKRGTKRRTVNNQLGALCRKLCVGSRAELLSTRTPKRDQGG